MEQYFPLMEHIHAVLRTVNGIFAALAFFVILSDWKNRHELPDLRRVGPAYFEMVLLVCAFSVITIPIGFIGFVPYGGMFDLWIHLLRIISQIVLLAFYMIVGFHRLVLYGVPRQAGKQRGIAIVIALILMVAVGLFGV